MTGRGFLVLGATGGIGSAVCSLLDTQGACVPAAGREPAKLAQPRAEHGATAVETVTIDDNRDAGRA